MYQCPVCKETAEFGRQIKHQQDCPNKPQLPDDMVCYEHGLPNCPSVGCDMGPWVEKGFSKNPAKGHVNKSE